MSDERPNILLFMVDQLAAFVLSTYGGRVCRTPNIDRFASRGVVFDAAYCPYPLCAPSRFGMMAGRLPSRIGAFDNGAEFPAAIPTFAHYLRLADYYTCISGKMHFIGPDQFHGFEERLTTEVYPADMSWTPTGGFGEQSTDEERAYEFGVSTVDSVLDSGPVARSLQLDYDEDVIHHAVRELYARARSPDRRPFMMTVSLTQPHDPYVTTREFWDLYSDEAIEPPLVPFVPLDERDPHSKSLYCHYGQDRVTIDDAVYRRARRGYFGMVSWIDRQFGHLLDALRDSGYADNTVVVFSSDHGDLLGERGMWFKKTLFEPAIHVPLIITRPGTAPARSSAPASLIDLFPTFVELAGGSVADIATPIEGKSLVPALEGQPIEQPVLVEHIDGGTAAPRVMVRDGAYKLVMSRAYPTQLYDLTQDPLELNDLAGDSGYSDIKRRLGDFAEAQWDLDGLAERVKADQTARALVDSALAKGRQEIWDFTPRPLTQNTNYVRRGDAFPAVERAGYLPYPKGPSA